ncbi:MAG: hypothetical protein EOP10_03065 [Proteobacteria bacterium]|nr:MAG: hypothetical protein EOP10_03065 [Pseudomonadota bacterium]
MDHSLSNSIRLRDPVVLAALVILILNDHIFKQSNYAGFFTGKISDFAGLFFFPFFAADVLQLKRGKSFGFAILCVITGLSFAALKLAPAIRDAFVLFYRSLGINAEVVMDASDLWALFVLPVAVWMESTSLKRNKRFEQKGEQHA